MNVIKRDKTTEVFQFSKIESAVTRAFEACGVPVMQEVLDCLRLKYDETQDVSVPVDEIHDEVENCLMDFCPRVAKAYIIYRYEHKVIRESTSQLIKDFGKKLMAEVIDNQNANVDERSFGGRSLEALSVVTKDYALKYCMSRKTARNHNNNEVYVHDLDSLPTGQHNCLTIPFDDLLANGFKVKQTDVRPANSINTAFQLVAVLFQIQSLQQFGGVASSHLDWTMVPYVRKSFMKHYLYEHVKNDDSISEDFLLNSDWDTFCDFIDEVMEVYLKELGLTKDDFFIGNKKLDEINHRYYIGALLETRKELQQAVEGMYHNLNTLQSRSGNQLPFSSLNYGTCTSKEGRMVIKALLEGSIQGTGKLHRTPIFPCGIFQMMDGVNRKPGDPNYDLFQLALKSTSRRLYPNYANCDWSGNAGYDKNDPRTYFSTMGCRTANGFDINGLGQLKDGRGNICPTTIILPTLAMEAKEAALAKADKEGRTASQDEIVERFIKLLDKKIGEAKDSLLDRFEWICKQSPDSAKFMWENNTMAGYVPEEGIRSALKHGTLAIGQLGLAEALQILIGCDHTEERGLELAKRIESLYKQRCSEYKEEYKLNYGVYYSPSENLCFTAMKKFRAKYGIIPNVSDREYFTNSMHVPVWHKITPFEKIDIESQLTGYSSAGCITYVELPSTTLHNLEALETLVNYAMDHDIPYFAINVPNDTCKDCGYTGEINDKCPMCSGTNIDRLRRVTGYLSTSYENFNRGKIAEVLDREQHNREI